MSSAFDDPGLQPERTALSWRRTALSAMVVAALMLRQAAEVGWGKAAIAPLVGVGILVVLGLGCYRRGDSLQKHRLHEGNVLARRRVMATVSTSVVLGALATGAIEITGYHS
ncbi:DUF202 domain-containing protein [Tomitella cavernea]|uniref:DUF202 domain-containing protein n=1 Tax=Tomitella cavernea TaxID=1387982 RepID=A0ABP9CWW6_9ACTN|nr:DUF202 domain-containing protein [Tomitella cavernea]